MLNQFCSRNTHTGNLKIESLRHFFYEDLVSAYESFADIFDGIDEFKIVGKFNNGENQSKQINKIIGGVYTNIIKFKQNEHIKGEIFSDDFLDNVGCLIFSKNVIHHSHISGKIIGYAHGFYNQKVRENKKQISVIAHNLFDFDFYSI